MGKENDAMLSYLEDNERFADLFNYAYFGGEQVVKADEPEESPEYSRMDGETARTISVLMGVEDFMENDERYKNGEEYNMCQALQEMMEDSRQEGISEGIKEGMCALIRDNLDEGANHERIIEKLQKYFSLSKEAACDMLKNFIN